MYAMVAQLFNELWDSWLLWVLERIFNEKRRMSKPLTFVLNDESKTNSYGFRVKNEGICLKRFKQNPVILSDHWNSPNYVIGRWENIRMEDKQLKADAVFDMDDDEAAKIAGKVERGFLKGASMGIRFSREDMVENPNGTFDLSACELYEASIVAVPSNANAVKLYSQTGELIDDDSVMLSLSEIMKSSKQIENRDMSKLNLNAVTVATLMAYGLQNADAPQDVDTAVAKLKSELDAEKKAHELEKTARLAFESQIKDKENKELGALVDQAIADGQILGSQKETFVSLGLEKAKTIISGLPKRVTLGGQVVQKGGEGNEPKDLEAFQKLSLDEQLAFKNANPSGYQALFAK